MTTPEERRRALIEGLRGLIRLGSQAAEAVDEVRQEILGALEEALGIELTPEKRVLRSLYSFNPPRQPSLEELRALIARSMGLEDGSQLEEYLRGLGGAQEAGSSGTEPAREGGQRPPRASPGADREGAGG
ncbi:hypothetical protein [Pyrodictium abyssi]|uniref:Uncharacterized protein n=1 Tax=Pyrodictium abyssi TaxID=54256 RepID=A0ABN6ZRX8_9CREN|nr:hypothetical protein PABY_01230 [Pyrodictium abyssi]